MTLIQLKSYKEELTLYEGNFPSMAACTEQAVADHVSLQYTDLRNTNLMNAALDGADLTGALLTGANMTGANLSEAKLKNANLNGAALYNSCMCYSDLSGCNFENASFGATNITSSDISKSRFSTLSCFTLDFAFADKMEGCSFITVDRLACPMSRPPIVIHGLTPSPIIVMDRHIKIGGKITTYSNALLEQERFNFAKSPREK